VKPGVLFVVSALLAAPAAAEVTVRLIPATPESAALVELTAREAPLNEVLDRLARQIGMKVVYEGSSPRQLVTLSLQGRSPAETVLALLEGQGVNYALLADPSGAGVQTLLVAGLTPQGGGPSVRPVPARGYPLGNFRRSSSPPPGSGPDVMETEGDDAEDEPVDQPGATDPQAASEPAGGPVLPGSPGAGPAQAPTPHPTPPPPATNPFPVSPFAPQPAPVPAQPFPPPPGAPGASQAPPTTPPQEPANPPPL
jgi:hypothetical protein